MNIQNILLFALAALCGPLATLLFLRIRREKMQMAGIRKMRLDDFSDFLRSNSVEGGIVEVARKVSKLLISSFDCDRIVFLRKKRGALDLNYYHGIKGFNRSDFRLAFSTDLADQLKLDFLPRNIKDIQRFLPQKFVDKMDQYGIDVFFPVFWRDNLYGIYFIRSNIETRSASFAVLVASLAQSLSAAYHIKWHESKADSLQKQLEESQKRVVVNRDRAPVESRFLKLVRHRNTETIVTRLMNSLKDDASIERLTYVYAATGATGEPTMFRHGVDGVLDIGNNDALYDLIRSIETKPYTKVSQVRTSNPAAQRWLDRLKERGVEYVASFPLTNRRGGVLAWSGAQDPAVVEKQLHLFKNHAFHLVENAESFEKMEAMSYTDSLTGLSNQRYFFRRLNEEINRAKRYGRSLALIIFDLDELKYTNDTFGHLAGDAVLKQMGEILKKSIRAIDVVARYGGDEFCVIMPEADSKMCIRFMDRLQNQIISSRFQIEGVDEPLHCTVSIGGAVYPDHADDSKKLIFAADMALLKAKETGRNKSLLYAQSS